MTIMIGIDPHKATHTAVAIDSDENVVDECRVRASLTQTERLVEWAAGFEQRRWAVESASGLGYLVSQQLVAAGEAVFDVPPVLASRVRVLGSARSHKKGLSGILCKRQLDQGLALPALERKRHGRDPAGVVGRVVG